MATQNVVTVANLGSEFAIGTDEAGLITVKLDGTITKNASGELGVDITALDIVSADGGNLLTTGGDGGAYFDQAALQAAETAWAGTSGQSFMTITPSGINGHAPIFAFDFSDPDFCEGVQDCVGLAIAEGLGLTYDDALNSITSAFANVTFGDGLDFTNDIVTVVADPNSPSTVTVGPLGVSVTPGISADTGNLASLGTDNKVFVDPAGVLDLATVDVCDAFGTHLFDAMP